jgi:hypothetical protein
MFQSDIARSIHDERIREMQRRVAASHRRDEARAFMHPRHEPRSIRRSIGRSIIRVGEVIAADAGQPMTSG